MKANIQFLAVVASALCLGGCAASSVKQVWKSPAYQGGAVQKVAVVAVEERGMVRQAFENRFVNQFRALGQNADPTHELMGLREIKASKEAAAARFREAGADSVLLVRLVDQTTYAHQAQATPALFVPTTTGFSSYGWYDYYEVAFVDMGTVWNSARQYVYLDTVLFDLKTGQRIWSALTLTVLKEDMDRLEEADALVAKIVAALRRDGMIRQ
jgi:hypothetical protein